MRIYQVENKEYYTIKDILKLDAIYEIKRAFKQFGIEGTEQKLKELYHLTPKLKYHMLEIYNELLNARFSR